MLVSPLPPFLGKYSRSTSFLGLKPLDIVISILVLWSICCSHWSTFSILRRGQPNYLSLWWDFNYVVSFWVVFSFPKVFFLSCSHVKQCPFPIFPIIFTYTFLQESGFCLYFVVLFLPSSVIFLFFIISMAYFSIANFTLKSWLYILTVCIRVSNYCCCCYMGIITIG